MILPGANQLRLTETFQLQPSCCFQGWGHPCLWSPDHTLVNRMGCPWIPWITTLHPEELISSSPCSASPQPTKRHLRAFLTPCDTAECSKQCFGCPRIYGGGGPGTAPGVTALGQVRLEGEAASARAQHPERGSRRGFTGEQATALLVHRVQEWWLSSLDQKQAGRRGRSCTGRCEGGHCQSKALLPGPSSHRVTVPIQLQTSWHPAHSCCLSIPTHLGHSPSTPRQ